MISFSDPHAVARYAEGPARLVPGLQAMQRMAALLLAEAVPAHGRVLVLGAGGGLELKVFAQAHPGWRLVGVDPSAPMLRLARDTLGALAEGIELIEGDIQAAPLAPFDGAACLLTLHFLPEARRLETLRGLARRLKPGAPLVVAHHSVARAGRRRWLRRYAAFGAASGLPETQAAQAAEAIAQRLPLLSPEEDEALMREAGFADVELFYAGFTFRGWVARMPGA